jgi:hypothetical protein
MTHNKQEIHFNSIKGIKFYIILRAMRSHIPHVQSLQKNKT